MDEETRLQSFQREPYGRILQVEAFLHAESNQHIVFWDDILEAFPGVTSILNGTVVVTRARDATLRFIEPRCIKYQAGKVLEVVGGEDLATQGESMLAPTPMPGQLTYRNIEQWAAMITPDDTFLGGTYAPTICTLTTNKTRPFKPLLLRTEADVSSVRTDSYQEQEQEDKDVAGPGSRNEGRQKSDQEEEDESIKLAKEFSIVTTSDNVENGNILDYPLSNTFACPPAHFLHGPNLHNFDFKPHPLPTPSNADTTGNSTYPLSSINTNATNLYNDDSNTYSSISSSSSSDGPRSPTSLSPLSFTYASLRQQPLTPPAITKPKKFGFLKSTFNRLSGRPPAKLPSTLPIIESNVVAQPSIFSPQYPLQADANLPRRAEVPNENEEQGVNLDELFRKVEAERVRRWHEQDPKPCVEVVLAKPYEPLYENSSSALLHGSLLSADATMEQILELTNVEQLKVHIQRIKVDTVANARTGRKFAALEGMKNVKVLQQRLAELGGDGEETLKSGFP